MPPLEILYQDDDVVAIDKPAGLLVHRSRIDVSAREFALQKLRDQLKQPVFLTHRLDRPTSGVLVFALHQQAARNISEQFAKRTVSKIYRAIVRGHIKDAGRWEEPLTEKHDAISDQQASENKLPQPAITEFKCLQRWEIPFSTGKYETSRYSDVQIIPLTGRKHQIRRHFNHMAHPIIGDTTHGDRRHNRLLRENFSIHRLLLVASSIELSHPKTDQRMTIHSPLGFEFENAQRKLNEAQDPPGRPQASRV